MCDISYCLDVLDLHEADLRRSGALGELQRVVCWLKPVECCGYTDVQEATIIFTTALSVRLHHIANRLWFNRACNAEWNIDAT